MSKEVVKVEREPYEADRPIKSSREDRFGRSEFAKRIASVIADRRDASSIVVGIYGPWGEGKTSVLNMVVEELKARPDILVLTFNPWRFQDETHLINNYFSLLAEKVGKPLKTAGENLGDMLRKYSDVLAPISYLGLSAKDLAKALASARPAADLEKLKGRVEEMLGMFGKRIVVMMDDIDRLDTEEVRAVFKLVKLSADFPNTAYILAFDEERVARALAQSYGDIEAGHDFIEKIVQVPLNLPPADAEALRELTFEGINAALELAGVEIEQPEVQRFVNLFVSSFESRLDTPRLAKRYVNGLTFALPILKGEVNPVDLMLAEATRTFYPPLYAAFRDNQSVFLGTDLDSRYMGEKAAERAKSVIDQALEGLSKEERKAAEEIIKELFPRMSGVLGNTPYGSDWNSQWRKEKRIASEEYYRRYFAYGLPPKDVSDNRIDELLVGGEAGDVQHIVAGLREIAASSRVDTLVRKLRQREDSLAPEYAVRLALAVVQYGEMFPQDRQIFGSWGGSAFSQACVLISRLLKRVADEKERDALALSLAKVASPLPFAVEYGDVIRKTTYRGETISTVSDECEAAINKKIAERIATEAADGVIFGRYPEDVLTLYRAWSQVDAEAARQSLTTQLQNHPKNVTILLVDAMPLSTSGFGTRKEELQQSTYDFISSLLPPEVVMSALHAVYGDFSALQKPNYEEQYNAPPEERAAWSFIQLHSKAQQQRQSDELNEASEEGDVEAGGNDGADA